MKDFFIHLNANCLTLHFNPKNNFMKTIKKALPVLILFTAFLCLSWNNKSTLNSKNTIVLVKYKTQPDKIKEAIYNLTQLIEQVKKEPHFVSIKLHVDPKDPTNILLYEEWSNAAYYNNEHMKTGHLQQFIANARNFLAGPPEISLWQMEKEF
jgi:quinol monooxygenase YgiN